MKSLLAIIVVTLAIFSVTEGYRQELIMHESVFENGTYYVFRSDMADFTWFPTQNIKRWCYRGLLAAYPEVNFTAIEPESSSQWWASQSYKCFNSSWYYPSFRFVGAEETEEDVVSLYPQKYLIGAEFRVTRSPFGGIDVPVQSVGYTGKSSWTVFEGRNFDGKSACLEAPPADEQVDSWGAFLNLKIETIRSLVKGCPANFDL